MAVVYGIVVFPLIVTCPCTVIGGTAAAGTKLAVNPDGEPNANCAQGTTVPVQTALPEMFDQLENMYPGFATGVQGPIKVPGGYVSVPQFVPVTNPFEAVTVRR
jgi:hypothetical protein